MKKLVCIMVAVCTLLCGCTKKSILTDVRSYDKESMFVICETSTIDNSWIIVYHKDTKVMYAISCGGYNSGNFTLLLNPDGSPMLWED